MEPRAYGIVASRLRDWIKETDCVHTPRRDESFNHDDAILEDGDESMVRLMLEARSIWSGPWTTEERWQAAPARQLPSLPPVVLFIDAGFRTLLHDRFRPSQHTSRRLYGCSERTGPLTTNLPNHQHPGRDGLSARQNPQSPPSPFKKGRFLWTAAHCLWLTRPPPHGSASNPRACPADPPR